MLRLEEGDVRVDISCKRFGNAVAAPPPPPPPPQPAFLEGRQTDCVDVVPLTRAVSVAVGESSRGCFDARRNLSPSHLLNTAEEGSSAAGLAKKVGV
jgi:hypothetical protein